MQSSAGGPGRGGGELRGVIRTNPCHKMLDAYNVDQILECLNAFRSSNCADSRGIREAVAEKLCRKKHGARRCPRVESRGCNNLILYNKVKTITWCIFSLSTASGDRYSVIHTVAELLVS